MYKNYKKVLAIVMSFVITFLGGCCQEKDDENISFVKEYNDISISDNINPDELLDYIKDYTLVDEHLKEEKLSLNEINNDNIKSIIDCILKSLMEELLVLEGLEEIDKIELETENNFINISYPNNSEIINDYRSFTYSKSKDKLIKKCFLLGGDHYYELKKVIYNAEKSEKIDDNVKTLILKTILSEFRIQNSNARLYIDKDKIEAVKTKKVITN